MYSLSHPSLSCSVAGVAEFLGFPPLYSTRKTLMNHSFLQAESLSPSTRLPFSSATSPLSAGDRSVPQPENSEREPIRHLLIGSPVAVQLTIHHLHILDYADAMLWSPAIALSQEQLVLKLNPGEVMRVLVRYLRVQG
jgi:hypothetical protein